MDVPEIKSCGFLVFRNEPFKSFLLMRHSDRWDLPKGHVDGSETELECAYRELHEETGINANQILIDQDFRYTHRYTVNYARHGNTPKLKELVIFLATTTEPVTIQLTEHPGFEWFPWQPPHQIQELTIDPLLSHVAEHFGSR